MQRMASGVYLVDDYPGEVQDQTQEMDAISETENTCHFFCPMCMKEYCLETEPGDCHEIFCECNNLVLFGRTSDKSGLVMYLIF